MRPSCAKEPKTLLFPSQLLCMKLPVGFPLRGHPTYNHRFQGYGTKHCRRCGAPRKSE